MTDFLKNLKTLASNVMQYEKLSHYDLCEKFADEELYEKAATPQTITTLIECLELSLEALDKIEKYTPKNLPVGTFMGWKALAKPTKEEIESRLKALEGR